MNIANRNNSFIKKPVVLIAGASLLVIGGALLILELTHTIHLFHTAQPKEAVTANSFTKGENQETSTSNSSASTTSDSQTTTPGDEKTTSNNSRAVTLLVPTGNFVSNHRPNLSGSPAPNLETSVCNTTPGASCQIIFTNGGITKSLPARTTDRGGAAYWDWKLQDIGLTQGSWQVKAVASLDGQKQTGTDPLAIEVGP